MPAPCQEKIEVQDMIDALREMLGFPPLYSGWVRVDRASKKRRSPTREAKSK